MMKVAIAGTNGLAQFIANYLSSQTSHQFIILSRTPNPGLQARGWQVLQVDYTNASELRFKLAGIDTVISTISGSAQIALIDAAAAVRVARFVPSEFEGTPSVRPAQDIFDNGRRRALLRLAQHEKQNGMQFCVFTCGIFYERFGPGGLAASQIGLNSGISREGDYILDFRQGRAQIPYSGNAGQPSYVCMTSARDVARFVVAAIDLPVWPRELRMCGDRMHIQQLVSIAEQLRNRSFEKLSYNSSSLVDAVVYAQALNDHNREMRIHHLIATAQGRYDFNNPNLNHLVDVRPQQFKNWLYTTWSQQP